MPLHAQLGEKVLRGIAASPGVSRGRVLVLDATREAVPSHQVAEQDVQGELQRLEQALVRTRHQIADVQKKVSEGMGASTAGIFDAHLLVLEDQTLLDEVTRIIKSDRRNVESAFQQVGERYAAALAAVNDEYLRERAHDIRDVISRVLDNLTGRQTSGGLPHLTEPVILIGHELSPSLTATLDSKLALGFATETGGKTSHTAILARSLQIPAVVGLKNATASLESGQEVLIDGYNGHLIINPTDQTLFEYGQLVRKQVNLREKLQAIRESPAVTLDNHRITLSANIEQAGDIESVVTSGADGVGLFRTEYLFINRETLPTEEEQFLAYSRVASALQSQPVIIRTLDIGGDKLLSHSKMAQDLNPFLGWRAIRFCLQERDLFKEQLRAILRASVAGNVKMMYPMISGLEELNQANGVLEECKAELRARGQAFNEKLEVGIMIEVPSAVMVADSLAKRVSFFSLGTNDLIQYSLAVDRLNERIAHLYEPTHPGILRLIDRTVTAARAAGIWVGVCGEMAGDPILAPLLLGLGVDELSASPGSVPNVKFLIRRLKMTDARALAEFALNCESGAEILAHSEQLARQCAPGLFENQT